MKIQVMSKEHGHQELVCLQREKVRETLDDIGELDRGYHIQARINGQLVLLQKPQVEERFDEIETILIRPTIVAG